MNALKTPNVIAKVTLNPFKEKGIKIRIRKLKGRQTSALRRTY